MMEVRQLRRKWPLGSVDGTALTLLMHDASNSLYGWFLCDCGNLKRMQNRYAFGTSKGLTQTTTCSDMTAHPVLLLRAGGTVKTAHARVKRERGPAREHPCAICARVTESNEWAYRHSSLDPIEQRTGKDAGQLFSLDPADYWCLCKPHHAQWDRGGSRSKVRSLAHHAFALAYDPYGTSLAI